MLTLTAASEKGSPPAAFRAVIQAPFESNVPVKIQYVTHRVAKAP
jgi:hypothetical protein